MVAHVRILFLTGQITDVKWKKTSKNGPKPGFDIGAAEKNFADNGPEHCDV